MGIGHLTEEKKTRATDRDQNGCWIQLHNENGRKKKCLMYSQISTFLLTWMTMLCNLLLFLDALDLSVRDARQCTRNSFHVIVALSSKVSANRTETGLDFQVHLVNRSNLTKTLKSKRQSQCPINSFGNKRRPSNSFVCRYPSPIPYCNMFPIVAITQYFRPLWFICALFSNSFSFKISVRSLTDFFVSYVPCD